MDDIQPEQDQNSPTIEPIRFRAGKRRKAYRQKAVEEEGNVDTVTISPASVVPGASKDVEPRRDIDDTGAGSSEGDSEKEDKDEEDDDDGNEQTKEESAVAAALRLRNARRAAARRGGVGFRSEARSAGGGHDEEDAEHALILRDQDKDAAVAHDGVVGGITNRFMHQTGLLTILDDQHIRNADTPQGSSSQLPPSSANPHLHNDGAGKAQPDKWRDQPTRHGKLVEVDMTDINNERANDNKRRRVDTDTTTTTTTTTKAPPRRGRNRRNSEDIARDALVEQFLHENRLAVYDVPATSSLPPAAASSSSAPGADPSADDRLAEQFRQQYYDEQARRRKKKRPVPQQQQQKQQSENVLRGPKLGGSRNMRAAVRDILLQQEKDKKGK
ncbi:hypothetical protein ACHAQJ_002859 [Trichoderma viride]